LNALDNLLIGDLMIYDPAAIKAIRDKQVREVSVGYKADYEETGLGRGKQRNIICNHLALVQDGRCGPICRIGDKAFYPRHEADCGCGACSTHDDDPHLVIPLDHPVARETLLHALRETPVQPEEEGTPEEGTPEEGTPEEGTPEAGEVPELDPDLLEISEGAPPSVMEALYAEQKRRNEGKPLPLLDPSPPPEPEDDTTWDHSLKTKRTGRFIHLHL
jgi:hypothetical protein